MPVSDQPVQEKPVAYRPDQQYPRVSILIAARNEAATVLDCLYAITQLTYPADALEVLIGDDQSTDQTGPLVADFIADKPNFNYQLLLVSPAAIELLNENILALWGQLGAEARLASAQQNVNVGMTDDKRAWASEKGRAEATLRAALASGQIRPPKKEEDPVSGCFRL